MSIPLLFLSDAISAQTGLARITRDLSTRVHEHLSDIYRVGVAGYGGAGSRRFSFPQYTLAMDGWVCPNLPEIWEDFAGSERGIVCCIWDASRLSWFSRPEMNDLSLYPSLKQFLTKRPFTRMIYAPVDASGPNDRLTWPLTQNLLGFDKIIAYGQWGKDVIRRSLGDEEAKARSLTFLPHGVDTNVFYPRDKRTARAFFFAITNATTIRNEKPLLQHDETLVGIVATNQPRKDFGMALEAVSSLSRQKKIRLWIHTDTLEREKAWSIPALLVDFGLLDRTVISVGGLADEAMAKAYSACDIVLGIAPEGFGYVHVEALACGTPCVVGRFGGGAELVPSFMQVDPVAYRYESIWASKRPVYDSHDWAHKANEIIGQPAHLESRYDWALTWREWEAYFREAAR